MTVLEPTAVLVASHHKEHHEKKHVETTAFWSQSTDSPFIPVEHRKHEHTHEENRAPLSFRYTPDSSIGTPSLSPSASPSPSPSLEIGEFDA